MSELIQRNYDWCIEHEFSFWRCPRCEKTIEIERYPATSRRDSHTQICSDCATDEAMFDIYISQKKDSKLLIPSMKANEREWLEKIKREGERR